MARMSITQAARQSGISRQYFYTKYIKTGRVTVCQDEKANKYIDEAELLRACEGRLPVTKTPSTKNDTLHPTSSRHLTPDNSDLIAELRAQILLLREQLFKAEQRECQLNQHIERLTIITQPVKRITWINKLFGG